LSKSGFGRHKVLEQVCKISIEFISSELERTRRETVTEAIRIFDKFRNEPMTGNVVILELKGLLSKLKEK
jgi:hypothetical protein